MANNETKNAAVELIETLTELLDEERDALLKGDYETVNHLFEKKKTLAEQAEAVFASAADEEASAAASGDGLNKAAVIRLQKALSRNEAMLIGAQKGVALARQRLTTIARKSNEVGVYDASGERPQMGAPAAPANRRY
ncbi:MAG: hypothetical protein AAF224_05090 [Pseudomonadota bacterium]